MRRYNIIISIVFMCVGVAGLFVVQTFKQIGGNAGDPGAKFWPAMLLTGMIIAAAVLLIRTLFFSPKTDPNEPPLIDFKSAGVHCVFKIFGIMILYAIMLHTIGFNISSLIFIVLVMLAMGERRITWIAPTAVGITLFIYLLFGQLMGVVLPKGILL